MLNKDQEKILEILQGDFEDAHKETAELYKKMGWQTDVPDKMPAELASFPALFSPLCLFVRSMPRDVVNTVFAEIMTAFALLILKRPDKYLAYLEGDEDALNDII